jgi:N-(2-amino-2-carboxyethyl)-L-glutamate synthase
MIASLSVEKLTGYGVLKAIGNTPLVELKNIFRGGHFRLFVKIEGINPGGSTKDRPAKIIIEQGIEAGLINPGTVIVESSSGNMGIGLAQICAVYGLRFICVVDPKTTAQNMRLLKVYGAEIDEVKEPDPQTGEFLQARINRVQELLANLENSFWPNQYSNLHNPRAHHQTMHEIYTGLGGHIDYLFCATSTCGTIRGCSEYLRARHAQTKVIAVDAKGSVIFGGVKARRLIPGHGAAVRPELFVPDMVDECVHVTDEECVVGCRRLVREEGILAGGSSGAVLMALERYKHRIEPGSTCATILPDRGERYLDTIYSDEWVTSHFGDLEHLWAEPARTRAWYPAPANVRETVTTS